MNNQLKRITIHNLMAYSMNPFDMEPEKWRSLSTYLISNKERIMKDEDSIIVAPGSPALIDAIAKLCLQCADIQSLTKSELIS